MTDFDIRSVGKCWFINQPNECPPLIIQQTKAKEYDYTLVGGEGDPLGIVQEIYIWPYY